MREDAVAAARGAKMFVYCIHLYCILVFLYSSTTPLASDSRASVLLFFTLVGATMFTYHFLTKSDPGYLRQYREWRTVPVEDDSEVDLCRVCDVHRPLRARHCNKCEECVAGYDHHCFWVGACVGEKNHGLFWTYLFLQTILAWWAMILCIRGFQQPTDGSSWLRFNVAYVFMFVMLLLLIFLPTGLLFYHTYLLFTNQTSWEAIRRPSVKYLKHLPISVLPFSDSVARNVEAFFCPPQDAPIQWEVPEWAHSEDHVPCNVCSNKYYECC